MKFFHRQRRGTLAAAVTGVSNARRKLLLLGMALAGTTLARRILQLPPRTTGRTLDGNGLSRHEAAFYSTRGTLD